MLYLDILEIKVMKKLILISIAALMFASCEKEPLDIPSTTQHQSSGTNCTRTQCSAIAKSTGAQCKRTTTNCNRLCFQHQ